MHNYLGNLKQIYKELPSICGLTEPVESTDTKGHIDNIVAGMNPFDDYLSYRYFDRENSLFVSDSSVVGFMLSISPIVGVDDSVHKNLSHFFNDELPEQSYLQFLLVASHEVDDLLDLWQSARVNPDPILQKITRKRAEFVRERATSFGVSDGRIARDYGIFLSFSRVIDSNNGISDIINFRNSFINKLESLQLAPSICDANGLIRLTKSMLQMELASTLFGRGKKQLKKMKISLVFTK